MNTTSAQHQTLLRATVVDLILLATACAVPTLSHLTALPLYMLNPMLLILLVGMVLVRNRTNACLMAVLLPVVSMLAVGMPTPPKALCMAVELVSVAFIGGLLMKGNHGFWGATGLMLLAVLCGKVVYYLLKFFVIAPALLISTPIYVQILSMVGAVLIYAALYRLVRD